MLCQHSQVLSAFGGFHVVDANFSCLIVWQPKRRWRDNVGRHDHGRVSNCCVWLLRNLKPVWYVWCIHKQVSAAKVLRNLKPVWYVWSTKSTWKQNYATPGLFCDVCCHSKISSRVTCDAHSILFCWLCMHHWTLAHQRLFLCLLCQHLLCDVLHFPLLFFFFGRGARICTWQALRLSF